MIECATKKKLQSLVSVVIPAYNVEMYIEKCLFSIMKQTYKNIEIIVVNDGSTDKTGQIIENVCKRDERIRVIHKENAGVSAARNSGIDDSRGEYLVFVDADDYLEDDYIEYMLRMAIETGAEFCLSKNCYTRNGERQVDEDNIKVLSPTDATALLLSPIVIVGCWNKIFKKKLLEEKKIRFYPELFYGEGLSFITRVSQVANCIGVGERKVYYYRRNNQNSATTKFNINKLYNGELALETIEKEISTKSSKIDNMLVQHKCLFYLGATVKIKGNRLQKEYRNDYRKWRRYIFNNLPRIFFCKDVSLYRKVLLLGGYFCPTVVVWLDNMRRKRITENSISG